METADHMRQWNKGEIQVMVLHPASAGHGLNLQSGGNIIVWFGQTWSLELYMQLNARLHRQGQEKPVIVNHLICKNTIDVDVHRSIKRKDAKQDGLMEAIKARIEKYKHLFDV
jgi:SNF2 family DNA or RNA helicase